MKQTQGTQITANRGEVTRRRNGQQWKKVKVVHNKEYDSIRRELAAKDVEDSDLDIEPPEHQSFSTGTGRPGRPYVSYQPLPVHWL